MTEPRPLPESCPTVPAYGSADGRRAGPAAKRPTGVWLAVGLSVVVNAVTLIGVLVLGWPAGNAFVLFWVENAVLGACSLVRVATALAPGATGPGSIGPGSIGPGSIGPGSIGPGSIGPGSGLRWTVGSSDTEITPPTSRAGAATFFALHYGLFCAVHLVFTLVVASRFGLDPSWLFLGLPVVLLLVRYGVELATTWFGGDGLRRLTSPRQAMAQPYPRIIVLHLAVLVAFALTISTAFRGLPATTPSSFDQLVEPLLVDRSPGVLAVVVLVAVKTLVDVATTRKALRAG